MVGHDGEAADTKRGCVTDAVQGHARRGAPRRAAKRKRMKKGQGLSTPPLPLECASSAMPEIASSDGPGRACRESCCWDLPTV